MAGRPGLVSHRHVGTNISRLSHPLWLVLQRRFSAREFHHSEILCKRMSWSVAQTIVRQLVSKVQDVDLIGALANIAEQTLDGIGCLNVSVHVLRKRIKGQQVLFVLSQASYRFWIALAVFGFEGGQLSQGLLFCRLLPDANEFSLDVGYFLSRRWIIRTFLLFA